MYVGNIAQFMRDRELNMVEKNALIAIDKLILNGVE